MHVVVIGAGLVGLSTTYFLTRAGVQVTVLERAEAPGLGSSHANGGLLTPSLADPWNAPGVLGELLRNLGRNDAPMLLHPGQLPSLGVWGLHFLRHSSPKRFQASFLANARLALFSAQALEDVRAETGIEFDFAHTGILKVFESAEALDKGIRAGHFLKQLGLEHQVLDQPALAAAEPLLAPATGRLAGGVLYTTDAVGDAHQYCQALARWLVGRGVAIRYSQQVLGFDTEADRVTAVGTPQGAVRADCFVLAAGCWSPALARLLKIRVPVVPVKGYSITVPLEDRLPVRPLVDDALHAAVVPLGGNRLRVAGTAEFAGFDTRVVPERIDNLVRLLERVYPHLPVQGVDLSPWAGLRPMTPDGRPLLGPTRIENLYLNTGHGALGWTLAAGSGKVVAEAVLGETPSFEATAFRPDRR